MAKRKPIFLFAFANDATQSLNLAEEERIIREILAPLHDQGQLEYLSLGNTSVDDIYKTFNRLHNRIELFHYSGHSGDDFLAFTDKNARASLLSTLMGQQKQLKLVFLNGCANAAQVEELFSKGIKTAIATSVPVADSNSIELSKYFYQSLASKKTIREAFDMAVARVKNDNPLLDIQYRGINLPTRKTTDFPWGLYSQEEKFTQLGIPTTGHEFLEENFILDDFLSDEDINTPFIELIFEGMSRYDEHYKKMWEQYLPDQSPHQIQKLKKEIFGQFPHMISKHLSALYNAKREARIRLFELNEAYLTLAKFVAVISISNVWEACLEPQTKIPNPNFKLREEYKTDLLKYLEMRVYPAIEDTSLNFDNFFDFIWLTSTISRIFEDNHLLPFIEEFQQLYESIMHLDKTYNAYRFLEQELRGRLYPSSIDVTELTTLCEQAGEQLGILYQKCAFLITYELISIKGIDISNPRKAIKADFVHTKAILKGEGSVDDFPMRRDTFASNQSVIITKSFQNSTSYLNLSPFILDLNVYEYKTKTIIPELHFFCGYAQGKNEYKEYIDRFYLCYERADTPGEVMILVNNLAEKKYLTHYLDNKIENNPYKHYLRKYKLKHIKRKKDLEMIEKLFNELKVDLQLK